MLPSHTLQFVFRIEVMKSGLIYSCILEIKFYGFSLNRLRRLADVLARSTF